MNGYELSGQKSVIWDAKDNKGQEVASGIYFYAIQAGDKVKTKKVLFLKWWYSSFLLQSPPISDAEGFSTLDLVRGSGALRTWHQTNHLSWWYTPVLAYYFGQNLLDFLELLVIIILSLIISTR